MRVEGLPTGSCSNRKLITQLMIRNNYKISLIVSLIIELLKFLPMTRSLFSALIVCFFSITVFSQNLIVGTFNLRYYNQSDSGNLWKDRSPICAALIRFHQFDIVGTQEGMNNQLNDLQNQLPEYAWFGAGREDGKTKGEYSAIFYKKDLFAVKDSGHFWLSETPDKPGAGWDASLTRICSWLKLQRKKDKKTFYVFNVHFDHRGVKARIESSKLMLQKIQAIAGKQPVVFTGDFNGNHESEWYLYLKNSGTLKDALLQVEHPYINNGSFNAFKPSNPSNEIIDHIFVTEQFKPTRYGILTDTYHGKFPSDHFPVLVELKL
jgi:endonuclease/exonuclease/phosphatase family metal-dependent hydrolase